MLVRRCLVSRAIFRRTEFDPISTAARVGMAEGEQCTAAVGSVWRKNQLAGNKPHATAEVAAAVCVEGLRLGTAVARMGSDFLLKSATRVSATASTLWRNFAWVTFRSMATSAESR